MKIPLSLQQNAEIGACVVEGLRYAGYAPSEQRELLLKLHTTDKLLASVLILRETVCI